MLKNRGMVNSLSKLFSIPGSRTDEKYSEEEQYNRISQGCGSPNSTGAILANTVASGICAVVIMVMLLNISLLLSVAALLAVYEICRVRCEIRNKTEQQEEFQKAAALNGSGKSTCLKALLGEFELEHGTAQILGRPVTELSHSFKEKEIGYCPAISQLFYGTAQENILMGGTGDKVLCADRQMQRLMTQSASQLSSGQKQRVNILRSLQKKPSVLILDEPDAGLDQKRADQYFDLIFSTAQTLIAVVHNRS